MRISDWSSDVCSSDLVALANGRVLVTESVGDDFPIAPQGRVYVIEKRGVAPVRDLPIAVSLTGLGESLTARERQITGLVLQGYPTEAIARKLGIGRGTVTDHRRRLYYKLDITSRSEEHTSEHQS